MRKMRSVWDHIWRFLDYRSETASANNVEQPKRFNAIYTSVTLAFPAQTARPRLLGPGDRRPVEPSGQAQVTLMTR